MKFLFVSFIIRQLVEEIVSERDNAKLAQQKLQQYKTDFVKQYKEEIKQLMKQALEEVIKTENYYVSKKTMNSDIFAITEDWKDLESFDFYHCVGK